MGQASILVMTSNGERTSPVMRGAFILSKMLGMPSPEPPPNVPQLDNDETEGLPVKEALKIHQSQPQCASCHKRIDPAGFGLEEFDASGAFISKGKVDSTGHLPGGKKFSNVDELKKGLMEKKDNFTKSLIEALMEYSYRRKISFADAKLVDELLAKTVKDKYRLGGLITNIVLSSEFRQK